ncbi:MAG: CDP-alcohol phosphatidyltransferase family protein [Vicinamibacteria bacterium]|nr:CDP-alcohol phosphatidyltransferase family protein [Vicinamibacteria bacterium]
MSLTRVAGIVVAAGLYLAGEIVWAFAIAVPAALTDYVDGWLARRRGEVTPLGSVLDLMADMLYTLFCLGVGVHSGLWPLYLLFAWGLRDLTVVGLRLSAAQQGFAIPSSLLGKVAGNVNYYAMLVLGLDLIRPFASAQLTAGVHVLGLLGIHVGIGLQWVAGWRYLREYAVRYRSPLAPSSREPHEEA